MRFLASCVGAMALASMAVAAPEAVPLVTGQFITPAGTQTPVGSFPSAMALSPDGRYVVAVSTGARQNLTVLDARTGGMLSQIAIPRRDADEKRRSVYTGLVFDPKPGNAAYTLFVARGTEDTVGVYTLSADGLLTDTSRRLENGSGNSVMPHFVAGLALNQAGDICYAVNNQTSVATGMKGSLSVLDTRTGARKGKIPLPGFPLAVVNVTSGPAAHRKLFVTSERDGVVSDVDPQAMKVRRNIATGTHPMALLLDRSQRRLFVANAGSDTVSIVSPGTDKVTATILLRPAEVRGLPGATPTGLALNASETRLYVTLADLNAVAVVDLARKVPELTGYIPTGWYPTAVLVAPDGKHLFVANGRGVVARTPNSTPQGPEGAWGKYVNDIIEGTVARIPLPTDGPSLRSMTAQVLRNNSIAAAARPNPLKGMPIKHVFYIIKENRTYDQILGDMKQGNGDPSIVMFGRDVTPNHHALAERFVLMDNYYCCADVSADGWNWSTSGMLSEYTARNVPFNYGGRGREYDFEGQNNGSPVDLEGVRDVATAPGGYIWDNCARHGVSFRNYGFFVSGGAKLPDGRVLAVENTPNKKALVGKTDLDYRLYDMGYADSDAWVELNAPQTVTLKAYGSQKYASRYAAWKHEFDQYAAQGNLPRFTMIRLPRDHTAGTTPGQASPRAMVADNDYAVGKIVETVSRSPFWKSSAIFIVEDDAQNGFDHVDAHRSLCLVISPFVKKGTVESRFYNTDSTLMTMEHLLGLPPMSRYDATAPVFDFWTATPDNIGSYTAVRPDTAILTEMNGKTAYRSQDSARMALTRADEADEQEFNDILWHAVMGLKTPKPPIHYGLIREKDAD